jgi:FtsP/CotA-like multicopper oxidase with cupredoxin domain
MTIIAADGIDVEPVKIKRFLIGVAETYDVLITMPETGAYELRATAHDGSAYASVRLGDGMPHPAPDVPKPNLYHSMGDLSLKRIVALTPAGSMGMSDSAVEAGKFDQPGMMGMPVSRSPVMVKKRSLSTSGPFLCFRILLWISLPGRIFS